MLTRYGPSVAIRKTFTVSVTPEQDAFIRERVKCGRFSSVSEVVRAGLRLLEREEVIPSLAPITAEKSEPPHADA